MHIMQALKAVEKHSLFFCCSIFKAPCNFLLPLKLTTKTNALFLIIKQFQCQVTITPKKKLLHLPETQFHFNLHFKHAYGLPQYCKSRIEFHQYSKYIYIFFNKKRNGRLSSYSK